MSLCLKVTILNTNKTSKDYTLFCLPDKYNGFKDKFCQTNAVNALNFNLVPSFRQSPTGQHATAGKLATSRIPQTNFYQGTAAREGTSSTPKNPSNSRDPASQQGSKNKHEGHIKDASINRKGINIRKANGNSSKDDHINCDESCYSIGMPVGCRNITARFTCCSRDDMNDKDMLEEPSSSAQNQQKASDNR